MTRSHCDCRGSGAYQANSSVQFLCSPYALVDLSFHSTPPGSLSLLQVSTRSEEVQHAALPVLQALAQLPLRHRRLRNRAEAGLQTIWARLAPKEAGASSAECRLLTHAARPYAIGRGQRTALPDICSGAYISLARLRCPSPSRQQFEGHKNDRAGTKSDQRHKKNRREHGRSPAR